MIIPSLFLVSKVDRLGARVNSFQWFVHRVPNKWANVDEWMPERWLGAGENAQKREDGVLWPFRNGPRMSEIHFSPCDTSLHLFL